MVWNSGEDKFINLFPVDYRNLIVGLEDENAAAEPGVLIERINRANDLFENV